MDEELKNRIRKIVISVFAIDEKGFGFDKTQDDFKNWDSLSHMSLVSALEEEFKISLSVDEISNLDSVKKILEVVDKHGSRKA